MSTRKVITFHKSVYKYIENPDTGRPNAIFLISSKENLPHNAN